MVEPRRGRLAAARILSTLASLGLALSACTSPPRQTAMPTLPAGVRPVLYQLDGDIRDVHDPSLIRAGQTYYLFSTSRSPAERLPIRCSADLQQWTRCGDVFAAIPEWARRAVPGAKDLWAPDISYFNGRYHVYYAVSTFGTNTSAIGLATNSTLDARSPQYQWRDEGMVIRSGPGDDWNAIDPNIVFDGAGRPWLAFGSFWSGIKVLRIDARTGKPSPEETTLYALAERRRGPGTPDGAIEAPFIVHHGDFYYLFVSFDQCCRGADSTYKIAVGRSSHLVGPYVDRDGTPMLRGGGTVLLTGGARWRGPGHNAVLQDPRGDLIVYHAYDAENGGAPFLRIGTLVWDSDGWPVAAPADSPPLPFPGAVAG